LDKDFFSRLLLVYSEPSGKKISWPKTPSEKTKQELIEHFVQIKEKVVGTATITDKAKQALDTIYRTWPELDDQRFKYYSTRRHTHLLRLCLVFTASRISTAIDIQDVMLASTLLSYTESFMPKALGEFGKSRNAEAANKIMSTLYETKKPMKMEELWKIVQNDLEKMNDLGNLINNLQQADKIQVVKGEGFLPKQRPLDRKQVYVDFNLLRESK
jgi:hypothetical protein